MNFYLSTPHCFFVSLEGLPNTLERSQRNNRVINWLSFFLYFHVCTKLSSKRNERQAIQMTFWRKKKLETTLENYLGPPQLSSVFLMIQSGDKNSFKVQPQRLFWKAPCYFQEWGNGNMNIGQGIQSGYWAWVTVAHSLLLKWKGLSWNSKLLQTLLWCPQVVLLTLA